LKASRFLVPSLLVTIVILVGLVVYQNRVIVKQSVEIRWMLAHCKQ